MEPELEEFLVSREAVTENTLNMMKSEKIDMAVLKDMSEDNLKQFIPKMGDRMAVIRFCKSTSRSRNRLSLIERITLSQNKSCDVDLQTLPSSSLKKKNQGPNLKTTRTVNIGWILNGTPVRERNGGGRRSCSMSKDAKKSDVLEKAISYYFPNGVSEKGLKLEDTDYDLLDYKEHVIDDEDSMTVGRMYAITGLNLLRFYLSTNTKKDINWSSVNSNKRQNPKKKSPKQRKYLKKKEGFEKRKLEKNPGENNYDFEKAEILFLQNQEIEFERGHDAVKKNGHSERTETNLVENQEVQKPKEIYDLEKEMDDLKDFLILNNRQEKDGFFQESSYIQEISTDDVYVIPTFDDSTELDIVDTQQAFVLAEAIRSTSVVSSSTITSMTTIAVHRGQIFKELTNYFIDIKTLENLAVQIEIIGTNGKKEQAFDGGGVLKDALTEYWAHFYESLCEGTTLKVPEVNYMYTEEKWAAIAKVLLIGYQQAQYFPIRLPKAFIEYAVLGKESSDVKEAFLNFVSQGDAEILKMAINDFDATDPEELTEVLTNLECKQMINKENISSIIRDLAHTYILQKPMYILDCFKKILRNKMTQEEILKVYENCEINNKRVLALIECYDADINQEKEKVLMYLKRFIRECEKDTLERFLRYSTGADLITCSHIQIDFSSLTGVGRRPIAYTCNNILELPLSYAKENFRVFKFEFNNILKSNIWGMDIV